MNIITHTIKFTAAAAICLLWTSCHHDHGHEHGHSHDHGGHSHDAGDHEEHTETADPRTALWSWSDSLEVFIDMDQPVRNVSGTWAVHLTNPLQGTPYTDVEVSFWLLGPNGKSESLPCSLAKPGYAEIEWTPSEAGAWHVQCAQTEGTWTMTLGKLEVWEDPDHGSAHEEHEGITVTKEQVWSIPFGVQEAKRKQFHPVVQTSGKWLAAPGDEVRQHAVVSGEIRFSERPLVPGVRVQKGEVLLTIHQGDMLEPGMAAAKVQAETEYESASAGLKRVEALHAGGAATASELQEARSRFEVAEEAFQRWTTKAKDGTVEVRADRSGVIREVFIPQGSFVDAGTPLLTLVTGQSDLLEIHLHPSSIPVLENWNRVDAEVDGRWIPCSVVSIGRVALEGSGLVPVYLACATKGNKPIPGTFASVALRNGEGRESLVVEESCLMERYGMFEVAVQTAGESYELKSVQIGERGAGLVEILGGISDSDLVVTDGAYAVRMTAMQGSTPSHGHTH